MHPGRIPLIGCAAAALLAGGCGSGVGDAGGGDPAAEQSPFGPTGIPPQLRARTSVSDAVAGVPGATADEFGGAMPGGGVAPSAGDITPESEIVWTDPDNPDAEIPELDSLLREPARGPWELSETMALRQAAQDGKCVMIWFTDSLRSPSCKVLSAELLSTPAFDEWASRNLVRLRVDFNAQAAMRDRNFEDSFEEMDTESRIKDYNNALKKRYRVRGYPTLVMLSPQGEKIEQYRGYRSGNAEFVWGQLRSAVVAGEKSYKAWRGRLEDRGYREWNGRSGAKIFAKLLAYRDGELLLVEPDGKRFRTRETRLSDADRLWINQQKNQRRR